nr:MAG TPA: hypothetical protein [Siphoviridae sp. ctRJB2]
MLPSITSIVSPDSLLRIIIIIPSFDYLLYYTILYTCPQQDVLIYPLRDAISVPPRRRIFFNQRYSRTNDVIRVSFIVKPRSIDSLATRLRDMDHHLRLGCGRRTRLRHQTILDRKARQRAVLIRSVLKFNIYADHSYPFLKFFSTPLREL